jgi:hypothetical protein
MKFIILVGIILYLGYACTGNCAYCVNFACYQTSDCGQNCVCAKQSGNIRGTCMAFD